MARSFSEIMGAGRILPVLTIDREADAMLLTRALVRGGIRVIEVTLRSEAALAAIRTISREIPDAAVGAGTVLNVDDLAKAADAGARFIVSPGFSDAVVDGAIRAGLPVLPGIATASEVMRGLDRGLRDFKFFPSESLGVSTLRHFWGPLPQARFCTTGGIDQDNAAQFLSQPNVFCVGGSWMATRELIAKNDWNAIEALARAAARL